MPVKNRAWCLRRVLKAIESIEYPKCKLKVVFVDDYSQDGSYELIKEWSIKAKTQFYDVKIIRARTNISQARNLCIKQQEGRYLLFWDSDVIPPPELLREIVEHMEHNKSIGIVGADYIYESGTKYKPMVNRKANAVYMGFTLIRREIFDVVGGFNENLSVGEDTEFGIRVVERTNYKIVWAPKPVLHLKKMGDMKRRGLFKVWLAYNFHVRAKEYYDSFRNLPRFLKARVLYYLVLPWIAIISLIAAVMGLHILIIILLVYLVPSVYLAIEQRGFKDGITIWLKFNVPTGLALSYGVLRVAIKRFVGFLASLLEFAYIYL